MKLNLLYNGTDIRAGYENIDSFVALPQNMQFSDQKKIGETKNLDWIAENGEVDEIIVNNILSFFNFQQAIDAIKNYTLKLKQGGIITIIDYDMREIALSISNTTLPINNLNLLLFGEQRNAATSKKSIFSMIDICTILNQCGLLIRNKRVNNFKFVVEAYKNV